MSPLAGPILVVEDDPDIRDSLAGFLELQGLSVSCAANGKQALDALTRGPRPALVLLDMAMPIMDGHKLLNVRKASEALQEVPIVIVSAGMAVMNARDLAVYGANYGVAAFLKKPVDPRQLLEMIERHALKAAGAPAEAQPAHP
ncbi:MULTISPECIES: response regulator [Myxococcaceae]|uniref:response regulator n=1 Tax=Myxococcaceae TaxID=31 RepID=UPI001E49CDD9|nr:MULTISPECIES: response regulator [Myxococcaceae]